MVGALSIGIMIGSILFIAIGCAMLVNIAALRTTVNKLSSASEDRYTMLKSEIRDAKLILNDVGANALKIRNLDNRLQKLGEIDDAIAEMHDKLNETLRKVKGALAGVDENTRHIFADLKEAVDKHDVGKLASVVRAAEALSANYKAIDTAMGASSYSSQHFTQSYDSVKGMQPWAIQSDTTPQPIDVESLGTTAAEAIEYARKAGFKL